MSGGFLTTGAYIEIVVSTATLFTGRCYARTQDVRVLL